MVTTFTFYLEGRGFESWPRQVFFYFFLYQNEKKGEEICGNESLGEIEL